MNIYDNLKQVSDDLHTCDNDLNNWLSKMMQDDSKMLHPHIIQIRVKKIDTPYNQSLLISWDKTELLQKLQQFIADHDLKITSKVESGFNRLAFAINGLNVHLYIQDFAQNSKQKLFYFVINPDNYLSIFNALSSGLLVSDTALHDLSAKFNLLKTDYMQFFNDCYQPISQKSGSGEKETADSANNKAEDSNEDGSKPDENKSAGKETDLDTKTDSNESESDSNTTKSDDNKSENSNDTANTSDDTADTDNTQSEAGDVNTDNSKSEANTDNAKTDDDKPETSDDNAKTDDSQPTPNPDSELNIDTDNSEPTDINAQADKINAENEENSEKPVDKKESVETADSFKSAPKKEAPASTQTPNAAKESSSGQASDKSNADENQKSTQAQQNVPSSGKMIKINPKPLVKVPVIHIQRRNITEEQILAHVKKSNLASEQIEDNTQKINDNLDQMMKQLDNSTNRIIQNQNDFIKQLQMTPDERQNALADDQLAQTINQNIAGSLDATLSATV